MQSSNLWLPLKIFTREREKKNKKIFSTAKGGKIYEIIIKKYIYSF